jgi:hypothetical protein
LNIDEKGADDLYNQLETLYQGFKLKYRNSKTITTQGHVTETRLGQRMNLTTKHTTGTRMEFIDEG